MKRNKRLTFANVQVRKASGEVLKVKQGVMESRALASVVDLVDISGLLSLPEVMKHRITEECLTLFNVNGTFRKTQKCMLLQKLAMKPISVHSYTAIVDIGMMWYRHHLLQRSGLRVMGLRIPGVQNRICDSDMP